MISDPRFRIAFGTAITISCMLAAGTTLAQEVTVQNDSLADGSSGTVQVGFDAGESAAAWLTSPCDGTMVAVQVFWRSGTGTEPSDIEDSITVFSGGIFPTPGNELARIDGPVMTDGVFNEFRYLDENMVIPLSVPVDNGKDYVVSFKFLNDPDPGNGPSVVNDTDGCQNGKNAIDANGLGWVNACLLGVGGDWAIRAVVDCAPPGGSGSIPNGGDTPGTPMVMGFSAGQLELSWEPSCEAGDTDYEVYEGFMGAYYSHFSKVCTTGGVTMTSFPADGFNRYYLVVPTNGAQEGSYGRASSGAERPQGGGACQTTQAVDCP